MSVEVYTVHIYLYIYTYIRTAYINLVRTSFTGVLPTPVLSSLLTTSLFGDEASRTGRRRGKGELNDKKDDGKRARH